MANLSKYFSQEEIKALQNKGSEFIDKFEKQQSNQLYRDANFLYNRTQLKQMEKAAEKYPNPLSVEDWTSDEMINHALEEMVDLSHYITLLKYRMNEYEAALKESYEREKYWMDKYKNREKGE